MGGNLFSTERLKNDDYRNLQNEVLWRLSSLKKHLRVPDSFRNKQDHGDLDIVLPLPLVETEFLKKEFKITDKDIKVNSTVISFKYKNFQVDLCHFPVEDLDSAFNYYRMGDCSNMMGVIARSSLGYRFTHKGLVYPIKIHDSETIGEIVVSKNQQKIMEFLDLNFYEWEKGFYSPEDLFIWLSKSKFFNKKDFQFENLNHENRTRNRKRKVYSDFVEWCVGRKFDQEYVKPENLQQHLFRGLIHFSEEGYWIDRAKTHIENYVIMKNASRVFSGEDIARITELSGPSLGKVCKEFTEYLKIKHNLTKKLGYGSISSYIGSSSKSIIEEEFKNWYKLSRQIEFAK